jgi:hypothetical protein
MEGEKSITAKVIIPLLRLLDLHIILRQSIIERKAVTEKRIEVPSRGDRLGSIEEAY